MNWKQLIKSKTFYSGLALIGYGASVIWQGNTAEGTRLILEGVAVIFLRDALAK